MHFQWLDRTQNVMEDVSYILLLYATNKHWKAPLDVMRFGLKFRDCSTEIIFWCSLRHAIPWQYLYQDQIIFPDEAVFEKVLLFLSIKFSSSPTKMLPPVVVWELLCCVISFAVFTIPVFLTFRWIKLQEEFTSWSLIVTTGNFSSGCR